MSISQRVCGSKDLLYCMLVIGLGLTIEVVLHGNFLVYTGLTNME